MRKDLEKRIKDLEARVFPYGTPPDQTSTMTNIIWEEWRRDIEQNPPQSPEEAWDNLIGRFKACPTTAEYGTLIEEYREVIIEETKRRQERPPDDVEDGDEH